MTKFTKWDDSNEGVTTTNTGATALEPGDIFPVGPLKLVAHEHVEPGAEGFFFFHQPRRGWMARSTTPLAAALTVGAVFNDPDGPTTNLGIVVKPAAVGDTCVWYVAEHD